MNVQTIHHLAQINIAQLRAPLDSPMLSEFVHFLEPINALAESSPGFIWRLKDEEKDNATGLETPFDDTEIIVNMSVWEDMESLRNFAFKTAHSYFVRNGQRWFHKMEKPHLALWWIPAGHEPTLVEAKTRLELLDQKGPTPETFNFGRPFSPQ
ncbi:MAG: DUF3291 domain-containing protein [Bacteroidota bacterium]